MSTAIPAVYENAVFRVTEPVDLPERCEMEVEVRAVDAGAGGEAAWECPEEKSIVLSDRDRRPWSGQDRKHLL